MTGRFDLILNIFDNPIHEPVQRLRHLVHRVLDGDRGANDHLSQLLQAHLRHVQQQEQEVAASDEYQAVEQEVADVGWRSLPCSDNGHVAHAIVVDDARDGGEHVPW